MRYRSEKKPPLVIPEPFVGLVAKGNDCYAKFEGVMIVDIICRIDKKYEKRIKKLRNGNQKCMYGKLNRVLCCTILGAKSFHDKLSSKLIKLGFK